MLIVLGCIKILINLMDGSWTIESCLRDHYCSSLPVDSLKVLWFCDCSPSRYVKLGIHYSYLYFVVNIQ